MTVVFLHGVPDTELVWDPLRQHLAGRETRALALPGFGTPVPEGFGSTRWEYADWLADELAALGEPVDLVAHDQGSVIAHGVIRERPELLRSWVLSSGVSDAGYGWHRQARVWQTQGLGEQACAAWLRLPVEERAARLRAMGRPDHDLAGTAARMDRRMLDSILALYRSEPFLGDWELDPDASYPPGLVLWGRTDPFQAPEFGRRAAERGGAAYVELDCGHWWQLERPAQAAELLEAFWARLDRRGAATAGAA